MEPRALCPGCRRPPVVCYCAHVAPIATRTRVLFLQHPRERDVAIGTVPIARRCLPNSELRVGVDFADDPVVQATLADRECPAVLLFPGPSAVDLRVAPPRGPVTLVLLDGTWSQAAKLLRKNPALAALPQYKLAPSRPSNYRIRREPAAHCVATIEALAEVLAVLEDDGTVAPDELAARAARLLAPFTAMVDRQLEFAQRFANARSRHARAAPRAPRPRPVPAVLAERPDDLVVVYGEVNAWPYDTPDPPPPEVIHQVAVRLATGERFEAVVAPRHPLAPNVPRHAALAREAIERGEPFARFAARFRAFVRPTDVLLTWGRYATDVLESQGFAAPARLDLRAAAASFVGARTGAVEQCAERLAGYRPAELAGGATPRAVARLDAICAVARVLTAAAQAQARPAATGSAA